MIFPVSKDNLTDKFKTPQNNSYQKNNNISYIQKDSKDEFLNQNDNISTKKKLTLGAIILAGLAAIGKIFKSRKNPKNIANEVKPVIETAAETVSALINKNKPKDVELAQKVYAKLFENSEKLNLKPEQFDYILNAIKPDNKDFMLSEGIDLIADKFERIKPLMKTAKNFSPLVSSLNKGNKNIFTTIIEELDKFKITDTFDISVYLDEIQPEKSGYIFNHLMPELQKYEKALDIKMSLEYAELFYKIKPETQDIIPIVANAPDTVSAKISKLQILANVTAENKDIIKPLLENSDKLKYDKEGILNALKNLKNKQAPLIEPIARNYDNIQQMNIMMASKFHYTEKPILDIEEIFQLEVPEEKMPVFNLVMDNLQAYKIEGHYDIAECLESIDPSRIDFIHNQLLPKLNKYSDVLNIEFTSEIIRIAENITEETIDCVDMVAKYAAKLGLMDDDFGTNYISLLCAVNKENMNNLSKLLDNIKESEIRDGYINSEDFKKLLSEVK